MEVRSAVTRMVMLASVDKDAVCTVEAAGTDAAVARAARHATS